MNSRQMLSKIKRTKIGIMGSHLKHMVLNKAVREVTGDLIRGRFGKAGFYLNRKITSKNLREWIVNIKRRRIGKTALPKGESAFVIEQNIQSHVNHLSQDGFTILDRKLSQDKVDAIIRYSEQIKCFDMYRSSTQPVDPNNPPEVTHVAEYKREDLVNHKPILEIVNDPGILETVQEYLGARPTLSNLNMWWSFGGRSQPKHAQLFHRDIDDWKFCKLFIYLTDVSADSGPHVYVKSSSQSQDFRKPRRYSDNEIEEKFGKENIIKFIDTRGAAFIVDTYGFHKGLLPKTGNRLLLQAQYSLDPIGLEEYHPITLKGVTHDPYINRLLYKS
jgi:hypothetical protein